MPKSNIVHREALKSIEDIPIRSEQVVHARGEAQSYVKPNATDLQRCRKAPCTVTGTKARALEHEVAKEGPEAAVCGCAEFAAPTSGFEEAE